MKAATASEIARLETMTITKVVERFESLFGEKCRSRNKRYLIRRIAWRLQANAEGDLSERARARAAELALDSEVRVTPPRETIQPRLVTADVQSRPALDQRLPPPGSMLHRDYKGRQTKTSYSNRARRWPTRSPDPTSLDSYSLESCRVPSRHVRIGEAVFDLRKAA